MELVQTFISALSDADPIAVLAVVVVAFLIALYAMAKLAFSTIDRLIQRRMPK